MTRGGIIKNRGDWGLEQGVLQPDFHIKGILDPFGGAKPRSGSALNPCRRVNPELVEGLTPRLICPILPTTILLCRNKAA